MLLRSDRLNACLCHFFCAPMPIQKALVPNACGGENSRRMGRQTQFSSRLVKRGPVLTSPQLRTFLTIPSGRRQTDDLRP